MERPGRESAAHREEDELMNAGKTIFGGLLIAGLALPAATVKGVAFQVVPAPQGM
jgi:hypothetical protein